MLTVRDCGVGCGQVGRLARNAIPYLPLHIAQY